MTTAPTRWKQVAEVRTVTFNFSTKMITGDTVATVVSITATTGITASAPSLVPPRVTVSITGGTANQTYRISCLVTTTLGETLELDVNIRVADGVN